VVIPTSALAGATFVVLADTLSRYAASALGTEPPVGAITALIGCPLFLFLLVRRRA
jgi:iron complex transport system permease protein